MSTQAELFSRFKTLVDQDYDIYYDATRGSWLMSQAYRQTVQKYLKENGGSKMNIFELRHLYVMNEVKTPTSGSLAFSAMNNTPTQFHIVFAKYTDTDSGNVYYNEAIDGFLRRASHLETPNTRYPQYDIVGEALKFTPTTVSEVTLNYYKAPSDIDVTSSTDLGIDDNMEDYLIQEAIIIATQTSRDQLEQQMAVFNQKRT